MPCPLLGFIHGKSLKNSQEPKVSLDIATVLVSLPTYSLLQFTTIPIPTFFLGNCTFIVPLKCYNQTINILLCVNGLCHAWPWTGSNTETGFWYLLLFFQPLAEQSKQMDLNWNVLIPSLITVNTSGLWFDVYLSFTARDSAGIALLKAYGYISTEFFAFYLLKLCLKT